MVRELRLIRDDVKKLYDDLGVKLPKESYTAIARMWINLTEGYKPMNIKRDFPLCFPLEGRREIIEICNIRFYTFCEHHALPFLGYLHYAYIPRDKVIGLSKPARVVDHFSKRLQIQERLTEQVSDALWEIVNPVAHVVETEAVHLCSIMRGIRTPDEAVRVRVERVDEELYKSLNRGGHLYHMVKDLLSKTFKHKAPIKIL